MSRETITTISPATNKPVVERHGPTDSELAEFPKTAQRAFLKYRKTPLSERQKIVKKALQIINDRQDELAQELTEQMGRPIAYTAKEVTTAVLRGEYLLKISEQGLADTPGEAQEGFQRYIKKVPLGPVLVLFAWNVSRILSRMVLGRLAECPVAVSVSHSRQLAHPSVALGQQCHSQAFTSNSDHRGASTEDLP